MDILEAGVVENLNSPDSNPFLVVGSGSLLSLFFRSAHDLSLDLHGTFNFGEELSPLQLNRHTIYSSEL